MVVSSVSPERWEMTDAYLGPAFSDAECCTTLRAGGLDAKLLDDFALFEHVAKRIADGAIVGWYQGRMEFGPRALGNRSIVCDARRQDMKDVLNARIKHREPFRPFAPSVLDHRGADYFEGYYPNPFMLLVLPIRPDKQDVIPAVTHVDGTGRLQSVLPDANPLYHRLIAEFERRTGVPVVLNTSFNLRGEPIVHRPEEAVLDFLGTGMDALVLGPYVVEKDAM